MDLECMAQVNREAVPQDSTEHLLHKATVLRMADIAVLPNMLIHRNRHREASKMRRQRNMS